jgi:hypothetical protein
MSKYIIDDVLELGGGDLFVAMGIDGGGKVVGPPTYVRVPRETFLDYEAFRALLMRDVGIAYDPIPGVYRTAAAIQQAWSVYVRIHLDTAGNQNRFRPIGRNRFVYVRIHLDTAGNSVTAWQTTMTVGV